MVPPFRDLTYRLYASIIQIIKPGYVYLPEQKYKLFEAFTSLIESLHSHIKAYDPKFHLSYKLYQNFVKEASTDGTLKTSDFNKMLGHYSMLLEDRANTPIELRLP